MSYSTGRDVLNTINTVVFNTMQDTIRTYLDYHVLQCSSMFKELLQ